MRYMRFSTGFLALAVLLLLALGPACSESERAIDGYVALVPSVLRPGEVEAVSLTLFSGDRLTEGEAEVSLLQDGEEVLTESAQVDGKGAIEFEVPALAEGDYELRVRGDGFADSAKVRVEEGSLLFLETDKPIYKPGQTLHIRVISLDSELKPVQVDATVEVQDAKGTKVFKKSVQTDEYGTTTLELPISDEPNLGVWKVTVQAGERSAELDVRVEQYVLPKYEVKVDLPKEWLLVDEPIEGKVRAEYSYGKPVRGELHIVASRYVGEWEEFASFSADIDGEAEFELPAVEYVAGVPEARGMGNVSLEITVEERATGYEEKTTRLLTVSESPLSIQIIPESSAFKPSLPFTFLVVTETPDNQPVDAEVSLDITYLDEDLDIVDEESEEVDSKNGTALFQVTPPEEAVALMMDAYSDGAYAYVALDAAYSPSGNFIHVEQLSEGPLTVGDDVEFKVHSTREAANFYYEVVSRGRVVFTNFSKSEEISLTTTPLMAPASKLLVYQILPNSEVAADYIPFDVEGDYPQSVEAAFSQEQVEPGEALDILVQTEGRAKVALVAVDRSVFILAENRLNLQQVFEELERLYMEPQVELHEASPYELIATRGAQETFEDAGLLVLSNKKVPEGKEYKHEFWGLEEEGGFLDAVPAGAPRGAAPQGTPTADSAAGLAKVQRIRQFFPETWVWAELVTDAQGEASLAVEAPDSITTWVLRAVALSQETGLGVGESELTVLQPFFIQVDLPYSAIRGEEFPVEVALYNYLDEPQEFLVEMEGADWFETLGATSDSVTVEGNDVNAVEFTIRPTELGVQDIEVTARSSEAADAIIKNLIIAPEGVEREVVENLVLAAGGSHILDTSVPPGVVEGSARAYLALTSSFLTQTIEGLDGLLEMPFGCGEQNMVLLAPDVFISRYLQETNQIKPEVMAKAEKLMITGYQRELTYRRSDGSFSAFGESDDEGSLWLTAFVLKTFSQAKDLIYIDESVLDEAKEWITAQQQADGSFESVGFVHHQEMMGGVQGKTALTAYVAIALTEAGETASSAKAVEYLEDELEDIDDPYAMAIVAYALELAESPSRDQAYDLLMEMAEEDEDGLHWGGGLEPLPLPEERDGPAPLPPQIEQSTAIEATGYATLALTHHGDRLNASRAAKWLVTRRNAYGGFGSTQDTVVALQALTEQAVGAASDVDLNVTIRAGELTSEVKISPENFDVLQVVEVPVDAQVDVQTEGQGELVIQKVVRFNLPEAEEDGSVFRIDVDYGTEQVEVNDTITVDVDVEFDPPIPLKAGMVVLDVAVPTGFEPVAESVEEAVEAEPKMKRFDVAGRKVILYIENMSPGESISFSLEARALYPVKAKGVASEAYSYYRPDWRGETLGGEITVEADQ